MLKFYYAPISVNARRVWVALLEKQISFQPIAIKLNGDQFESEFTAINPLQRIPVIEDDGLRVIESLAILDYLEAKYPEPALMPKEATAIATVRMVEMVAVNELQPATLPLTKQLVGFDVNPSQIEASKQRIDTVLKLYENMLGERTYFAGDDFSLAEVVAGTLVPSVSMFGFAMNDYPKLAGWLERLKERESFQKTTPSRSQIEAAIPNIQKILASRS
ncbi:MAG TPA: glutathione S-transferase family protein [Leptolyngbyaceae cyanobacterium]